MAADDSWLFRQGDLILGPVPGKQIVDKLYAGELEPSTDVQALGSGTFVKLRDVPEFQVHVAKAAAKKRVDAHADAHHKAQRRKLAIAGGALLAVLVVLGVGVAVVGRWAAVHASTGKSAEELAWGDITIEAPTITRAHRSDDEEMIAFPGHGGGDRATGTRPRTGTTPGPVATREPKAPVGHKPKMGTADSEGMQMGEVDQSAINEVIARHRGRLIPCLKAVAKPGMFERVPIEFAISDTGKVTKVWVDNPTFKNGPLPECLLKELQTWPFKGSPSGGATVQLSFNIGKRG